MKLILLPGAFSICRLDADTETPAWALAGCFASVTHTDKELSMVCRSDLVPAGIRAEGGWRCFEVEGPLAFSLTGVMASLSGVLAEAKISLFAVSTFDTDYILVRDAEGASRAWTGAGHTVLVIS